MKNKIFYKKLSFLILLTFCHTQIAFGQTADNLNDTEKTYPYEQIFTITAYYSPIEGQKRYIKGSLEKDKILNGNGTHGADGTPVYNGMIAAPAIYPFGTKMKIEGVGTAAVHDRGGAIKSADSESRPYDRLDIWMGSGDEGLTRALNWGKRSIKVTVYGKDNTIKENIDWSKYNSEIIGTPTTGQSRLFAIDLGLGSQGDEVKKLQENLKKTSFYNGEVTGLFGDQTFAAVLNFQLKYKIVDDENDFGAGYFGPQTRRMLEKVLKGEVIKFDFLPIANAADLDNELNPSAVNNNNFLSLDLKIGDSGSAVTELQQELRRLNLFGIEPTGYYGEVTVNAVLKFQQNYQLASDKDSIGAGIFGPQTRAKLIDIIKQRSEIQSLMAKKSN